MMYGCTDVGQKPTDLILALMESEVDGVAYVDRRVLEVAGADSSLISWFEANIGRIPLDSIRKIEGDYGSLNYVGWMKKIFPVLKRGKKGKRVYVEDLGDGNSRKTVIDRHGRLILIADSDGIERSWAYRSGKKTEKVFYKESIDGKIDKWCTKSYHRKRRTLVYQDSEGEWFRQNMDKEGRETKYMDNTGFVRKIKYHKNGVKRKLVTFIKEPDGTKRDRRLYKYDEAGREIYFEKPDGSAVRREFDDKGRETYCAFIPPGGISCIVFRREYLHKDGYFIQKLNGIVEVRVPLHEKKKMKKGGGGNA